MSALEEKRSGYQYTIADKRRERWSIRQGGSTIIMQFQTRGMLPWWLFHGALYSARHYLLWKTGTRRD